MTTAATPLLSSDNGSTVARVSVVGRAEMAAIAAMAGRDSSDRSNDDGGREVMVVFVAARAATAVIGAW